MTAGPQLSRTFLPAQTDWQPCPRELKKYVLAVAVLGSSLAFIDTTAVAVALAAMREDLGASFLAVQWVAAGYALVLSAFLLLGGAAADALGRWRVFRIGIAVFALASAACGLAPRADVLIAARGLQGLAAAVMVPGALALIATNFVEEERGRAIGIWAAWSSIAAALGPFIGGFLIDIWSWRAIFYLNLPVAAAALFLLQYRVPVDFPDLDDRRFDLLGGGIVLAAMGLLALGLTLFGIETGSGGLVPVTLVLSGLVGLVLFVMWEASGASAPMMPVGLFLNRTFTGANIVTLLLYMALGGLFFLLPVALIEGSGRSAAESGAVFLPFSLAMALVARQTGPIVDRFGSRLPLAVGAAVTAVAFALLAVAVRAELYATGVLPAIALLGAGMGLAVPPLSAAVLAGAPASRAGMASAVNNTIARFAGLVAVAALGGAATLIYRETLGGLAPQLASVLSRADFAMPVDGPADVQAIRAEAVRGTFAVVAFACAAAAALSAGLARLLLPRTAPAGPAVAPDPDNPFEPELPPWRRIDLPDPLVDHARDAPELPLPPAPEAERIEPRFVPTRPVGETVPAAPATGAEEASTPPSGPGPAPLAVAGSGSQTDLPNPLPPTRPEPADSTSTNGSPASETPASVATNDRPAGVRRVRANRTATPTEMSGSGGR